MRSQILPSTTTLRVAVPLPEASSGRIYYFSASASPGAYSAP
jgi:hypothetical protein